MINLETLLIVNEILENEIGITIEELDSLDSNKQRKLVDERYNPNKTIKHYRLCDKVFKQDGSYYLAGMHTINERRKMNQEFEKVLKR